MEFGSVVEFLQDKTILVTGATGFIAKIFVEKILRIQPKVKKIYLLLRASDVESASLRFRTEVIGRDLFRLLKERLGANLNAFISEKTVLVPGDISDGDDLGVGDSKLKEEMWNELDIVVNLAATTSFDERYDVALGINTLGVKHVLCFAKKCVKLMCFLHVSTAYVAGERSGLILETPYQMGESLNGVTGLDVYEEKRLVKEKLNQLQAEGATLEETKVAMENMGIDRAKVYGWPNTYAFTKAMGEMVVGHLKEDMSVVILRPTIVTSTYKEPFPGWTEGLRTIDSIAIGYGKGRLSSFIGDVKSVIDLVPADMVVNAMIVAMAAHANRPSYAIYQVGSSLRNPLNYANLRDIGFIYFTNKPWIGKDGKPVKVGKLKVIGSMTNFRRYMAVRYIPLLKALRLANSAFCHQFEGRYNDLNRKIKFVMRLVELYRPYSFFQGVFDDMNVQNLLVAAKQNCVKTDMFYFDTKCIDWEDYFMNTHIPGLIKYVCK
ncbi:hypothetical protein K2173_014173 [Erythroxylum novogranatense]|uniref:Fatty acyl-CoA reductase n=1 Tax=Erythroxylum novogranatense TaxID=1862640 RepID=A0AAV8SE16_9ROSI|nr:hypothetical protein K2173_014173 [Erythroxylum novogranatense]